MMARAATRARSTLLHMVMGCGCGVACSWVEELEGTAHRRAARRMRVRKARGRSIKPPSDSLAALSAGLNAV